MKECTLQPYYMKNKNSYIEYSGFKQEQYWFYKHSLNGTEVITVSIGICPTKEEALFHIISCLS